MSDSTSLHRACKCAGEGRRIRAIAGSRAHRYTPHMPSHVAHLLFADDVLGATTPHPGLRALAEPPHRRYLVLGAQGPDIFYHNQRRRPTSIAYGSLMHRRGYGTCVAHMCEWAAGQGLGIASWAGALIVGFTTHAVLDRHTHPFINAHSGWPEPGDRTTETYRSMHPFLERLIDVELLRMRRGIHPNDLGFYRRVTCGESAPAQWIDLMNHALSGTYRKASLDRNLDERLRNAYLDAMGYYRFTDRVDGAYLEEALAREDAGQIGPRWLSIIHPPEVPHELDVLNQSGRSWPHPCPDGPTTTKSFLDCYEQALEGARAVIVRVAEAWSGSTVDRSRVEEAVTNWNLSDGRATERPCRKHYARPLPLRELQTRIRESIRSGSAGRLHH